MHRSRSAAGVAPGLPADVADHVPVQEGVLGAGVGELRRAHHRCAVGTGALEYWREELFGRRFHRQHHRHERGHRPAEGTITSFNQRDNALAAPDADMAGTVLPPIRYADGDFAATTI